jgi:hypothetical protein
VEIIEKKVAGNGEWLVGELGWAVTIVKEDNDRILFNSICDPDNRPSICVMGMNKSEFRNFYLHKTSGLARSKQTFLKQSPSNSGNKLV